MITLSRKAGALIRYKANAGFPRHLVTHDNFADRIASCRRCFIRISALSTSDGSIEDYHGFYG